MSKILLDGESIYDASKIMKDLKSNSLTIGKFDALMNVVYGIVLWDEVYVLEEAFNSHYLLGVDGFREHEIKFQILQKQPVQSEIDELALEHFFEYEQFKDLDEDEKSDSKFYKEKLGINGFYKINWEGKRALDYLLIANEKGLDYMPSVKRVCILQSYNFMSFFSRKDVLNKVDLELRGFYKELNNLIGRESIKYSFPILLDYLLDKYQNLEDIIKAAFELKYDSKVIKFRKEMDNLEHAFLKGDLLEIKDYFENIGEIIKEIAEIKNTNKSIDITLSVPPAISTTIDMKQTRRHQCLFIKDLAYYGIRERQPKPLSDMYLYKNKS